MELRWVEKTNCSGGRYTLQQRHHNPNGTGSEWTDVPCESPKPENWCEHITWERHYRRTRDGEMGWYINAGWGLSAPEDTKFCPICGKERPQ